MGIFPIWGFQLAVAIFLSILLKLNKTLVIIAANISIPPMIPVIIFLSHRMGAIWMGQRAQKMLFSTNISLNFIKNNFEQYLYGSISLAFVAALSFGVLTFLLLKTFRK